jgi:hypothetical protein
MVWAAAVAAALVTDEAGPTSAGAVSPPHAVSARRRQEAKTEDGYHMAFGPEDMSENSRFGGWQPATEDTAPRRVSRPVPPLIVPYGETCDAPSSNGRV